MSWTRPIPTVGDTTSAAQRGADPTGWRFSDDQRAALYEIISARRDIRRFRPDPLDQALVHRLLEAAHMAPSVGLSQPWRFVVVTEDATRERASIIAERERLRQAAMLEEDASRRMLDLQLDGIREAPVGIVVCCDRRTDASGILGRATFGDADLWSCACAIQNLWLAARAEGVGLGWVTLFPPRELAELVTAPSGVETLGWLCLGWPDERPPAPGLERQAWARRSPLDEVVINERWGRTVPAPPTSRLRAPVQRSVVSARDESDLLLTPPGSLGALDRMLERLVALSISGSSRSALILVAADHPVSALGVSAFPSEVTREVLEASIAGVSLGAATARAAGLEFIPVDVGVNGDPLPGVRGLRPFDPRGDLVHADALSIADVHRLVDFGRKLGEEIDAPLVAIGEAGIANTTIAAALSALLLDQEVVDAVGLGSGGDNEIVARKVAVIDAARARVINSLSGARNDPLQVVAAVGGPEFATLAGIALGVAGRKGAIVLDGFATSVAALVAVRLEPGVQAHLIAGQRSRERSHKVVLEELGLEALLDLRLRAGEGVGAVLATQILLTALNARETAARVLDNRTPEAY